MKVIEIAQAKSSLAEYVQEVAKEPVIVAKKRQTCGCSYGS